MHYSTEYRIVSKNKKRKKTREVLLILSFFLIFIFPGIVVIPIDTINDKYQEGPTPATLQRAKTQRATVTRENWINEANIFNKVIFLLR